MSLPLGAESSCGITSTTVSPSLAIPPVIDRVPKSDGSIRRMASIRMVRFFALSRMELMDMALSGTVLLRSALLAISAYGMPRCFRISCQCASSPMFSPTSRSAMSASSRALRVRLMRCLPSSVSSSNPAVSMKTHGPASGSSMFLRTGSVVVPGVSATRDVDWSVSMLTNDDFPLLQAPSIIMCSRFMSPVFRI